MKIATIAAAALLAACTPEQCEDNPDVCPGNSCGLCPCPVGTVCVEQGLCASLCALDVLHIPQGNPCAWLSEDAVCVPAENTPAADLGVCRDPSGAPLCEKAGET